MSKLRITDKEKLSLITNLSSLVNAGISLFEAIETLSEQTEGSQKKILVEMSAGLEQGKKISSVLEKFPKAFDPVTINLLRSAENSGNLGKTLKDLSENIERDIDFKNKVQGALVYPGLIMVLFLGVVIMILTYVIPRISSVFSKLNVVLPLPTKIMIASSEFFLAYWPYITGGFVVLLVSLFILYRNNKRAFVNLLFSLPLISKLARKIDLARFTKNFNLMLASGIPITEVLDSMVFIVQKADMAKAIVSAKDKVSEGNDLSESLSEYKDIFPPIFIKIVNAGEKSGTLEESMLKLSVRFEKEVEDTLDLIVTILEPAMLVVLGVLVGGIMLSIIAPIYQLIGNISPR